LKRIVFKKEDMYSNVDTRAGSVDKTPITRNITEPTRVAMFNDGAYMVRVTVNYIQDDLQKELKLNELILIGEHRSIFVPSTATFVRVRAHAIGSDSDRNVVDIQMEDVQNVHEICYLLAGSIFHPVADKTDHSVNNTVLSVTIIQRGFFVIYAKINYLQNRLQVEQKTTSVLIGQNHVFRLQTQPNDTISHIRVRIHAVGNTHNVVDEQFLQPTSSCYLITGSVFNPVFGYCAKDADYSKRGLDNDLYEQEREVSKQQQQYQQYN
ncbi:unnamed protein product, partial [Didymodactylos carnosus]